MDLLRTILAHVNLTCFVDIYKNIRGIGKAEKSLMQNVVPHCNLLSGTPATSCTQKRSFSMKRHIKIWLRSTMTNKHFNLNVPKELTGKLDLAEAGNEFIPLNEEQLQYLCTFVESNST